MDPIDVDEITEVNFPDSVDQTDAQTVEVVFKDGSRKVYAGPDLPEGAGRSESLDAADYVRGRGMVPGHSSLRKAI